MRKLFLSALVVATASLLASPAAAALTPWNKTFGGAIQTGGGKMIEEDRYFGMFLNAPLNSTLVRRANGEYLLRAHPGKSSGSAFRLYRLNASGKSVAMIQNSPVAMQNTSDGGFVVLNSNNSTKNPTFTLSKYSKNNTLQWKKAIPMASKNHPLDLQTLAVTTNNEVVIGGGELVPGLDRYQAVLKKFASNGTLAWSKIVVSADLVPMINSVRPTSNGGVIVSGQRRATAAGADEAFVMMVDSSGQITWDKNIVGCNEAAVDAVQLADGTIAVASNVRQAYSVDPKSWNYETERSYWVTRVSVFSATGTMHNERFVQGMFPTDTIADLCQGAQLTENQLVMEPISVKAALIQPTVDGGFLLTGTRSTGIKIKKQKDKMWVTKLNADLNTVWEKELASADNQYGYVGLETAPNEYVVAGINKKGQRVVQTFVK